MKNLVRTFVMSSLMMLVLNSCDSFPITQEGKVKKVATAYIEQGLKDGESMHWGSCGLRIHLDVNGKRCTYTEVKYTVLSDGKDEPKTLYLLLSENCDELYAVSDKKGGDAQDPVWQAVNKTMRQSLKETQKEVDGALKDAQKEIDDALKEAF